MNRDAGDNCCAHPQAGLAVSGSVIEWSWGDRRAKWAACPERSMPCGTAPGGGAGVSPSCCTRPVLVDDDLYMLTRWLMLLLSKCHAVSVTSAIKTGLLLKFQIQFTVGSNRIILTDFDFILSTAYCKMSYCCSAMNICCLLFLYVLAWASHTVRSFNKEYQIRKLDKVETKGN